ncbi:MAG: c-type cytochrome [Bryobacteraceae bacterium]
MPAGRDVALTMASEDVLHSFFVPAFRLKHDLVPGTFQHMGFRATKPGRYHIFCAEYCGTDHSGMIGWVTVMTPVDYANWMAANGGSGSMVEQGERLFQQMGCVSCHLSNDSGRGPTLNNVYGHPVQLEGGKTMIADESYIRNAIIYPNLRVVNGYKRDIMPNYQGQISEEGLMQLLVYVKSLSEPSKTPAAAGKAGARAAAPAASPASARPSSPAPPARRPLQQ